MIPGGLVVRIRRSHRRGRGSIPRQGKFWHQFTALISPPDDRIRMSSLLLVSLTSFFSDTNTNLPDGRVTPRQKIPEVRL